MSLSQDLGPVIRVVSAAIVREGALLLVRKRGTDAFMLPGGKAEPGEDEAATLRRELDEELGCGLHPESVALLGRFAAPAANEPGFTVQSAVYRGRLEGRPAIRAEIAQMLWFDLRASHGEAVLAPLLRLHVLPALRQAG
ncbi:NUDIX hydrolase [Gluconacetobacter diazotrophicus PA1 5]|uniref:NUDIX domain-containing protein n=2 Tax=Gluconacetobacter diazotrophicus TaxID=33996 RepID=A0A7W4I428_GLUDI|nr:NUDIX domain-containing protein [Gluconacetobacter diazotrophicus]ACI52749.1 NUDIX hydrolase [Gluconacetobacter diazotrophicus PA1 5]MBB2155509.1 NUDIX domain-containing protein [Gluconacetobacter diazotrophicus]TWB06127.1 8-oxo-dGTP diphosphatase [Gluconacetobacter diazotrophicus]CAP57294.1 putative (di)nucleoside polyphosphate hydrolase [Gluconacetobacter diazotrophicus PA1 5]